MAASDPGAAVPLAPPDVAWVGGSRLTPPDAIRIGDRGRITRLAQEAVRLTG